MSNSTEYSEKRYERLCGELRRYLTQTLGPALGRTVDAFDAALFDRASKARGAVEEQRLLDALRELRRKRSAVETAFVATLGAELVPQHRRLNSAKSRRGLSLFPRDELEETLSISSLAMTANARVREPLAALNCRLQVLLGVAEITNESNVIGPQALAEQFRDALGVLDIAVDLRMLAYRQLQANVFEALGACYRACNKLLVEGGVLPVLPEPESPKIPASPVKQDRRRTPAVALGSQPRLVPISSSATTPVEAQLSGEQRSAEAEAGAEPDHSSSELAELYRRMLKTRQPGSGANENGADRSAGESIPRVPRARLLEAAAALLSQPDSDSIDLKHGLLKWAQQGDPAAAALGPEVEGTVDLVQSLFARMRADEVLPGPLATALNSLRIPFLHAALRDGALLTDPEHPAVQLIDEFGDTARGWSPSADPGQRLIRQMGMVRSMLAARCEQNHDGFDEALDQFRDFMLIHRAQSLQSEQRVIESARSRESLQQAKIEARLTLESHMAGFRPSPWLRQLLLKHWASYIVLLLLRYGAVSDYYRHAVAFADTLLKGERDSNNPIHAGSFRARQGELETVLRQGLATLAYSDDEILRLCAELRYFVDEGARANRLSESGEGLPMPELDEQPRPEAFDPSVMRHLRGLRPGTWFELGTAGADADAEAERGRLCWISPVSGRWMLVNWAGRKIAEMRPEKFAEDIARGLARVIGDSQVLRRAIQSVMDELNDSVENPERGGESDRDVAG